MTRSDYLNHHVTHQEYYLAVADAMGRELIEWLVTSFVATPEAIAHALTTDPHLNNIPLPRWDALDRCIREHVGASAKAVMAIAWTGAPLRPGTFCWSLGDSVCVAKAVARELVRPANVL